MQIQELTTTEHFNEAYSVMHELRTDLNRADYLASLPEMIEQGYRLFALRDEENTIVALAGVAVLMTLSFGRHAWVYDLVTADAARSRGYGAQLLGFIEEFAREQNCQAVALASGVQRLDAHRFYEERMNYERFAFTFKKIL